MKTYFTLCSKVSISTALENIDMLTINNEKDKRLYKSFRSLKCSKEDLQRSFYFLRDCACFCKDEPIYNNKELFSSLDTLEVIVLMYYLDVDPQEIPHEHMENIKFGRQFEIDTNTEDKQFEGLKLIDWREKEHWKYWADKYDSQSKLGQYCLEQSNKTNNQDVNVENSHNKETDEDSSNNKSKTKKLLRWLIRNEKIYFHLAISYAVWILIRFYMWWIEGNLNTSLDYYTPSVYLILFAWKAILVLFYIDNKNNILYRSDLYFNDEINEGTPRGYFPEDGIEYEIKQDFFSMSLLFLVSFKSLLVFGEIGVFTIIIISLLILSYNIYLIVKNMIKQRERWKRRPINWQKYTELAEKKMEHFTKVCILLIYPIYYISCYQFGDKEIGSIFEKLEYETKYYVYLSSPNGYESFKVMADVKISNRIRPYEEDIIKKSEHLQLKKVYLNDGREIVFDNCFMQISSETNPETQICRCKTTDGLFWRIYFKYEIAN